MEPKGPLLC